MRIRITLFTFCLLLIVQHSGTAKDNLETHSFSVIDLVTMKRISDPQVSPDNDKVVFTLRTTDMEANKGRTDLWMINVNGDDLQQLTTNDAGDFSPRWSPMEDAVYFLSTRSGSSQIWKLQLDGGEPMQVTDYPLGVSNLVVSPDGKHLAFTVDVFIDCETIQCTKDKLDKIANRKASGVLYDKLFIRHWDTWKDGRRSHIFVIPAAGGQAVDIMKGMDADSPSKPFGGPEEITFTPDGTGIVFTARVAGNEEAWSTDFDLYHVPIDGSQPPQCLTEENQAWDTNPVFSPDGKTLAYLAMKRPGYESDRFVIMLREWPSGKLRHLTENWDRSPSTIFWAPDNKRIFAVAENLAQGTLFSISAKSGAVDVVVNDGHVRSPSSAGKRIVFGLDNLKSPVDLYSVKTNGKGMRKLTDINSDKLKHIEMGDFEQFTFPGWNNEKVYGYIVKPANFNSGEKYPVAFLIHGGPQGSFGNDFHYRWNPQTYAGSGYAVVMVDFHGSVGYGQAFTDAIRDDWGGKPLVDLQKGLAAALEKYPWMDGDKVGALGASFGGYMINWIAGNWPDRFRCLVSHDGNLDERMAYFDTEELWFPEWDKVGTPWENPEGYEKHNPVNYVQNWKTPMLVIHGEYDYRVVVTQGISTFTALQRRGIPSQFLYFPDENHWVLKPHNSILWHETVTKWLDQWLK